MGSGYSKRCPRTISTMNAPFVCLEKTDVTDVCRSINVHFLWIGINRFSTCVAGLPGRKALES